MTERSDVCDLGNGEHVVLHVDGGQHRIEDPEVHHRVHSHRDVVPGDAVLGRHRHGGDLHVDLPHPVHHRQHRRQARPPDAVPEPAEPEDQSSLVLLHHPGGHRRHADEQHQRYQEHNPPEVHENPPPTGVRDGLIRG